MNILYSPYLLIELDYFGSQNSSLPLVQIFINSPPFIIEIDEIKARAILRFVTY